MVVEQTAVSIQPGNAFDDTATFTFNKIVGRAGLKLQKTGTEKSTLYNNRAIPVYVQNVRLSTNYM